MLSQRTSTKLHHTAPQLPPPAPASALPTPSQQPQQPQPQPQQPQQQPQQPQRPLANSQPVVSPPPVQQPPPIQHGHPHAHLLPSASLVAPHVGHGTGPLHIPPQLPTQLHHPQHPQQQQFEKQQFEKTIGQQQQPPPGPPLHSSHVTTTHTAQQQQQPQQPQPQVNYVQMALDDTESTFSNKLNRMSVPQLRDCSLQLFQNAKHKRKNLSSATDTIDNAVSVLLAHAAEPVTILPLALNVDLDDEGFRPQLLYLKSLASKAAWGPVAKGLASGKIAART